MPGQIEAAIDCPYCGEAVVILVDPSVPSQVYVEDCAVCCQPMEIIAELDGDSLVRVDARREDDG